MFLFYLFNVRVDFLLPDVFNSQAPCKNMLKVKSVTLAKKKFALPKDVNYAYFIMSKYGKNLYRPDRPGGKGLSLYRS